MDNVFKNRLCWNGINMGLPQKKRRRPKKKTRDTRVTSSRFSYFEEVIASFLQPTIAIEIIVAKNLPSVILHPLMNFDNRNIKTVTINLDQTRHDI